MIQPASVYEGCADLPRAAVPLAQLALRHHPLALPELPLHLLLPGQPGSSFTAWQAAAAAELEARTPAGDARPCIVLLSGAASPPLLLAAARLARAAGNQTCAGSLLERAGTIAADSSSTAPLSLVAQLQRASSSPEQALRVMQAARVRGGAAAEALVGAAAQILLRAAPAEGGAAAHLLAAMQGSQEQPDLPSLQAWEQQLRAGDPGAALHFAALETAVAAAPGEPSQWWQLAAWLHDWTRCQRQQRGAAGAALTPEDSQGYAAAVAASCRALALGASSSSSSSSRGATLPLLLQLLRVLTRHSSQLPAEVLESSLASVPAAAWLPVLPQLLSLVVSGDGSPHLLGTLHGLLVRVAGAEPAAVLLPLLVDLAGGSRGAAAGSGAGLAAAASLVQQLAGRHPALAQQLRALADGCSQLAVLPEEHWHALLLEACVAAAKRLQPLQAELQSMPHKEQVAADVTERYLSAAAPVLLALRQQLAAAEAATAGEDAPPHARQWASSQLPRLQLLLEQLLAAAPLDAAGLQHPMALLRQAAIDAAAPLRRRQLSLSDAAPSLAALRDTAIPLPGAPAGAAAAEPALTVAGLAAVVGVLPTKTRPKKVTLLASNGEEYTYLLKVRTALRASARAAAGLPALLFGLAESWGAPHPARLAHLLPCAGARGPARRRAHHASAGRRQHGHASRSCRRLRGAGGALLRSDAGGNQGWADPGTLMHAPGRRTGRAC